MKGKDFKPNEKTIKLLDGKHRIAMDFNAFEQLEVIYGNMQTAFNALDPTKIKFIDIKNFLCAGINACIENEADQISPHYIGKLLDISKLEQYTNILVELLTNAMTDAKEGNEDTETKN